MHWLPLFLLFSSFFLASEVFAGADALRGKIVAGVRCAPCHHLDSNYIKVGPGLAGIFGRAPSISGVPFGVWNEASLQAWLLNPRRVKANTKMLMPHLSGRDRNDIIAWLKSVE